MLSASIVVLWVPAPLSFSHLSIPAGGRSEGEARALRPASGGERWRGVERARERRKRRGAAPFVTHHFSHSHRPAGRWRRMGDE